MPVRHFAQDRSASVAVTFGLVSFVVFGIVAMAITVGDAYSVRNKTQHALDAAVLAAASAPYGLTDDERIALAHRVYDGDGTLRADGTPVLRTQTRLPATFTMSSTTVLGSVDFKMQSPFMGVLGERNVGMKVTSAARRRMGSSVCVLGLDPTEEHTIDFNGKASLQVEDCAVQANSVSGEGIHQVGHPSMKAKEIGVTGGYTGTDYWPMPITGTDPIADPFALLPAPPAGACHPMSGQKMQQTTARLTPGTYCGGLTIKSSSIVTLDPGIYVFKNGPLLIDSQAVVQGSEVLLAFLGPDSTLYLQSGASLTVTSPTSGPYANIQFFGDRQVYYGPGSNGSSGPYLWFTVIGDARLSYDGVLYAPSFHVWTAGGSVVEAKSPSYIAIAKKLWFQDNTQVHFVRANTRGLDVPGSAPLQYGAALFE